MSTHETTEDGPTAVDGGESPVQARDQVEYDLSTLLVDNTGSKENKSDGSGSSSSGGSFENGSNSSDSDSTSGFASCRSKGTRGTRSRGTMSRNISNASTILELPDKSLFDKNTADPMRRDSPYRFDLRAMRTVMTSFRGVPELQNSFRLSKHGSIRHLNDLNASNSSNDLSVKDDLLSPRADDNDDDDEADVFLPMANNNKPPPAEATDEVKASASTIMIDAIAHQEEELAKLAKAPQQTQQPPPQQEEPQPQQKQVEEEEGEGIDDLIFDEATGTYVYRDYEYTYPGQPEAQPVDYHEPCQTNSEHNGRFTLEEIQANAAMGLDDDADGGGGGGGAFDDENCEMEISPGIYVPFRGAKETWQAVATQTTHELDCFDCGLTLVCINDCEFTVCPDCRVVNPIFCEDPVGKPFGVGMGFNKAWVLKKQHLQRMKDQIAQLHE